METNVSVIISTYNQPRWLEKVLWSYEVQTMQNFEIIIADDGSEEETLNLINSFKKNSHLKIKHIWHEDDGFQKTKILNKAILQCDSDYIFMTDGDCVVRNDMLALHLNTRKKGFFLSGGSFKIPLQTSNELTKANIIQQECFTKDWLLTNGVSKTDKLYKITAKGIKETLLNKLSPTKATWDGNNASAWKDDILAINGFDERMQYGGEDREFGERLMNLGVKPIQLRYSTKALHLFHERGYVKSEMLITNKKIRKETKRDKTVFTPYGIKKIRN
ncbi:glycosyltransferase family 2 protein [Joostella sp.]|uniref:glycosyltransferase family 2 protein n=1 Tax=Joostella sp. TaxID=2231138 RepID=UPI003A940625